MSKLSRKVRALNVPPFWEAHEDLKTDHIRSTARVNLSSLPFNQMQDPYFLFKYDIIL